VIARGIFNSVKDLRGKIMKYIREYDKGAKPLSGATVIPVLGSLPIQLLRPLPGVD